MTESDRDAISQVIANLRNQCIRHKEYTDLESVQYWLERLDDNTREIVREYFGEAIANPSHPYRYEATHALSWFGWPNPERNARYLADSLHRYPEGTYEYDDLLIGLLKLRHPPVSELVKHRTGNCDHRDCRCSVLIAHLAYMDPPMSLVYAAELLCRYPGPSLATESRIFFTLYGHFDPSLLKALVIECSLRDSERARLLAKIFAGWLDWYGTWGTDDARRPLRGWMLLQAGTGGPSTG